jgi:hypothetical protein
VKARLGSIENYIAILHGDQARSGGRIDDLVQRVERLEKRAGLDGAIAPCHFRRGLIHAQTISRLRKKLRDQPFPRV